MIEGDPDKEFDLAKRFSLGELTVKGFMKEFRNKYPNWVRDYNSKLGRVD